MKQSRLFAAFALCACTTVHAQTHRSTLPLDTVTSEIVLQDLLYRLPPQAENFSEEKVFGCLIEEQPYYPGGTNAMYRFIKTHQRIPPAAKRAGVSGRVFVSFMIDVTGEISDVQVIKGIGFGCDAEAVRIVKSMPRWIPGKRSGKVVRVKFNLPINFDLNQ